MKDACRREFAHAGQLNIGVGRWIRGDKLVGDFATLPLDELARNILPRFDNFAASKISDPNQRIRQILLPELTKVELDRFMHTASGQLLVGPNNKTPGRFANYFDRERNRKTISLVEWCMVNTMEQAWSTSD